jgi:hypothetical protein
MTEEQFEYQEPQGKGMTGDLSAEEASTGSGSKNWTKKTADFGFGSKKTKEDVLDQFRRETTLEVSAVKQVIKEYKKLKKYSKSNLRAIRKLSGQSDILDKLQQEYYENPEV